MRHIVSLTFLIYLSSCGTQLEKNLTSDSKKGSEATRSLADPPKCLSLDPGPESVAASNDVTQCAEPTEFELGENVYYVETEAIMQTLYEEASSAMQTKTGSVCTCGCYLTEYSEHLPRLQNLMEQMDGIYQTAQPCTRVGDQLACHSGPKDLTPLGRSYFVNDFLEVLHESEPKLFEDSSFTTAELSDYLRN